MRPEGQPLSIDQIRSAEAGKIDHPVLTVLTRSVGILTSLHQENPGFRTTHEQQRFIQDNFGFLADAIEEAGDFPLTSLDMVAISSKARSLQLSDYERRAVARATSTTYGCAQLKLENPSWIGFPRRYLEAGRWPKQDLEDRHELQLFKERIVLVSEGINELYQLPFNKKTGGTVQACDDFGNVLTAFNAQLHLVLGNTSSV